MNKTTYDERVQVYDDAQAVYSTGNQLIVALEEFSEIQKEICKAMRGEVNLQHLAEEVADATIMLEQIRHIFDINEEVCGIMDAKVERLRQRIQDVKDGNAPLRTLGQAFLEKHIHLPTVQPGEE